MTHEEAKQYLESLQAEEALSLVQQYENAIDTGKDDPEFKAVVEKTEALGLGGQFLSSAYLEQSYVAAKVQNKDKDKIATTIDLENARMSIAGRVSFWDYAFMLDRFEDLKKKETMEIRIASGGGDAFAGLAIHDLLKGMAEAGVGVYTRIDGYALSAAGLIFLGAPKENRSMSETCLFMAHNALAYLYMFGNRRTLKEYHANVDVALDKLNGIIVGLLDSEMNADEATIRERIENGPDWYLNRKEAIEMGIIKNPGPHSKTGKGKKNELSNEAPDPVEREFANEAEPGNAESEEDGKTVTVDVNLNVTAQAGNEPEAEKKEEPESLSAEMLKVFKTAIEETIEKVLDARKTAAEKAEAATEEAVEEEAAPDPENEGDTGAVTEPEPEEDKAIAENSADAPPVHKTEESYPRRFDPRFL